MLKYQQHPSQKVWVLFFAPYGLYLCKSMFIKNQIFNDEETLLEQLFDFGLGDPSADLASVIQEINLAISQDENFQAHKATIADEEEAMELEDDAQRAQLANYLMSKYIQFVVEKGRLFGINGAERVLLYSIDFY